MIRDKIITRFRHNETVVRKMLICTLFLLCAGVAVKAVGAVFQKQRVVTVTAESTAFLKSQDEKKKEYLDAYVRKTEMLKEKGMFVREKPKPSPPQVVAILGHRALMNNKCCNVDDEHAGAKVLKIEPTQVTILWEGKEMTLAPLLASTPKTVSEKSNKKDVRRKVKDTAVVRQDPETPAEPVTESQAGDDPLAWLGRDISPELRDFLLKVFEMMPADQLERSKQEWANMSDEQKQQHLDEAQKMVDSGQAEQMLEQMKASQG